MPGLLWRVVGGQPPALVRALSSRLPRAFLLRPLPALHRRSCPPCWSPPYTTYKGGRWPSRGAPGSWWVVSGQTLPWPPGAPFSAASAEFSKASDTGPPAPPCSLLGSLEQGSPPLPTWPSAGHQRLPCGHIQGSPFRSHLSQLSEPLPAPQDSVFSRLGGCAWVHLASLLHPD